MTLPPKLELPPFTIWFLSDGLWRNDGGCMMGVVPRELWATNHPPDQANRIRLNLTCPLIVRGNQAVLVDCGIGNRLSAAERKIFAHEEGWLPESLQAIGLDTADVSHVLLSHLHFDHCGGLVRARPSGIFESAFPRARHFIQRGEYEVAMRSANPRLRAAYRHVAQCLEPLRSSLELCDGDVELMSGVHGLVTGGHTADHQVTLVTGEAQRFIHLADIVPTRSHLKPAWNQSYDLQALRTMDEKARYLKRAAAENWWISFAHDDQVFTAHAQADRDSIRLTDIVAVSEDQFRS